MDLSTLANVATALTVIVGVAFGLLEARRIRRDREERAALEAVHALLTPAYMDSFLLVQTIRDGATVSEIQSDPKTLQAARSVGLVIEGLGFAVFERIVPLSIIDNFAVAAFASAGESCDRTLSSSGNVQVRKSHSNGFSGWQNNSKNTTKERQASRKAPTKYIENGHHNFVPPRSNQSMKPAALLQENFSVIATTPCRGLSLSR